jgi:hypothetical protein
VVTKVNAAAAGAALIFSLVAKKVVVCFDLFRFHEFV